MIATTMMTSHDSSRTEEKVPSSSPVREESCDVIIVVAITSEIAALTDLASSASFREKRTYSGNHPVVTHTWLSRRFRPALQCGRNHVTSSLLWRSCRRSSRSQIWGRSRLFHRHRASPGLSLLIIRGSGYLRKIQINKKQGHEGANHAWTKFVLEFFE